MSDLSNQYQVINGIPIVHIKFKPTKLVTPTQPTKLSWNMTDHIMKPRVPKVEVRDNHFT